jgi:hypothetical protein
MDGFRSFQPICRAATAMILPLVPLLCAAAQVQQDATTSATTQPDSPYTLHVTTREVVVDVVAVDVHNRAVRDLDPVDLMVFEKVGRKDKLPGRITRLRFVEPSSIPSTADASQSGFRISISSSCRERASVHYELAYQPSAEGWTSGYHEVEIRTSRRGVKLYFRQRYYVGLTDPPGKPIRQSPRQWDEELRQAACGRPALPFSISLRATLIASGQGDILHYGVTIDPDSLAFIPTSSNGRQAQLDYAVCNFNAAGQPLGYLHAYVDQTMSPVEYARAEAHGFPRLIEFSASKDTAMTRFVVRDRTTGNFGSGNVLHPWIEQQNLDAAAEARVRDATRVEAGWAAQGRGRPTPAQKIIGSFGSIVPVDDALCGDVYEIPNQISSLPDFRELNPVGSIYTNSLDVPNQEFWTTSGIPGVTSRTEWFGIDYYGTLWVRTSGTYEFHMSSDDGAIVQIDDQRVIDLDGIHPVMDGSGRIVLDVGRHTIHIPYYQGPVAVALILWVKSPNADWKLFDIRDFAPPLGGPIGNVGAPNLP